MMTARIHWIVAILLAFPGLAKSELSVRVMSPKTKILSKEPLHVQFVWTNNSAAPESVYNTKPISVSIQGARSLKTSKLYRTMAEQTKLTVFRPVILQPGHSYSQTYVPLILAMDVNGKNPWFLFKQEGEYQLTFPDKQGCSLNIQVRKPGIPQDVKAHELFSVGVGQALLGETWRALEQGKQDLKLLARLAGDHPASFEFNISGIDSRKSPDPVSTHSMRTVLMDEQGKWLVVSDEFLGSQQSPKVVLLIQLLMKDLRMDFDSVKILDAGTPALLSDVLKQKSDLAASTVISDFKVLSMTMMGSNKNDPLIFGEFVGKSKESTKKYSYKLQLSAPKQGQTFLLQSLSVDSE